MVAKTLPDDPLDKATAWVAQDWLPYLARSAAFGTSGAATRVAADPVDSAADVGGVSGGVHQKRRNPRGGGPAYDAAAPLTEASLTGRMRLPLPPPLAFCEPRAFRRSGSKAVRVAPALERDRSRWKHWGFH